MSLFSKKKNIESDITLPDLPEIDEGLPSIENNPSPLGDLPNLEVNELPPLPNNENIGINQSDIKSEINKSKAPPLNSISGEYKPKFQLVESSGRDAPIKIGQGQISRIIEPPTTPEIRHNTLNKSFSKEVEPIYVRLDKFQTTVGAFEEIREKVIDIEKLLIKIKETREKEDRELEEWENEIQVIKSRIESVDKNIFNKLD